MKQNTELLQNETIASKLIKKGFWLYFFTFLIAPTGYIIRVILSNDLSVEDVGLFYSIISFVSLISIYNDLGLTASLQYFLPKYWINKKYNFFKTSIILSLGVQLITGFAIFLLLYFGADFLAEHYFHTKKAVDILQTFCFFFLGINLYQVLYTIYSAFQDVFNFKLQDLVKMLSITIFTIFFFLTEQGSLENYTIARIIGLFISIVVSGIIFYYKYNKTVLQKGKIVFDKPMLKEYGKYAIWTFLAANAGRLLGHIDQQMIVYFIGAKQSGYYANYLSLLGIVGVIVGPVIGILFPIAVEFISKKQTSKIKLIQNFFYKYFSVFALSFGVFMAVFGGEISVVLFGEKFLTSGRLLLYSGIFVIFMILLSINLALMRAMGKIKKITKIISYAMIINVILNLILINTIGILGAVFSTIIGQIFMFILSFKVINSNERIIFDWKFFGKNAILFIILGGFLFFAARDLFILENSFRYTNLLYLAGFGLGYYLIIAIFNYKEILKFKEQLKKLKNKSD